MKKASLLAFIGIFAIVLLTSGCNNEVQNLRNANNVMSEKIQILTRDLRARELELNQCRKQLAEARALSNPEMEALKEKIELLNSEITSKTALIRRMQEQLSKGSMQLPMELNLALKEFADNNEMVTFDEATGVLKFKSDLLFKSGSAQVLEEAKQAIALLADIMNTEQAGKFDIIVEGHTDSDPIKYSKHLHATNWHLSSHRAIAVLEKLVDDGISAKRLSARGFGEQRPVQPNDSKEGKAANRRVEIKIIAPGM